MSNFLPLSRVVFWNLWGHRDPDGIKEFLKRQRRVDIFCFTEVTHCSGWAKPNPIYSSRNEPPAHLDGYTQLAAVLPRTYRSEYKTAELKTWKCARTGDEYHNIGFGNALFYRSQLIDVVKGAEVIFVDADHKPRILQWITYIRAGMRYLVAHFHGLWIAGNTKGDDPIRHLQSKLVRQKLLELCTKYEVSRVMLGGDFNLDLHTVALKLLVEGSEDQGMLRNLITEYKITSTRTARYREFAKPDSSKYADYVLVSKKVSVSSLTVDTAVTGSDHAPLLIEFM